MSFAFLDRWHAFLPRDGGHVVAFMGSGGKTSLLREAAAVYAAEGVPTIMTTTTRCEVLSGVPDADWNDIQSGVNGILPSDFFVHRGLEGSDQQTGKWVGLSPAEVDGLSELFPDRIVLVEVDGAAGQALKIHRDGEPVWPARTSLTLVVMGVGAVGGRADRGVHRWGQTPFAPFEGLPGHTVLEWSHLASLLGADGGYLAQVPEDVPTVLALTGLGLQDDAIGLFEFVGRAMERPAMPLVMFCARDEVCGEWRIRTACMDREK